MGSNEIPFNIGNIKMKKETYEIELCFHEYIMEVDKATFEEYIKISGTNNAHDIVDFENKLVELIKDQEGIE